MLLSCSIKKIILDTETREMNISSCSMMAIKANRIDAVFSLLTQVKSANQQDMTTVQEVVQTDKTVMVQGIGDQTKVM